MLLVAVAVVLGLMASPAAATVLVPPIDFDTVDKGALIAGPMTNEILTPPMDPPPDEQLHGNLTGRVWRNSQGIYTYEVLVNPVVTNISGFGTSFSVLGFNGVAGWSFLQAAEASAGTELTPDMVWEVLFFDTGDQALSWLVSLEAQLFGFWRPVPCGTPPCPDNSFKPMTFFFQSTLSPGSGPYATGPYSMINAVPGASVNFAPGLKASAGPDQTVNENQPVQLNGTQSAGNGLAFSWTQIAGDAVSLMNPTTATPSFLAPVLPGGFGSQTLTFQLAITTSDGAVDVATVNVVVVSVNHAPVAVIGGPTTINEGSVVALSAGSSYDPDGDPITYQWTQTGGPPVTLQATGPTQVAFYAPGVSIATTITIMLTVWDGALSGSTSLAITVESVNHPPVANAGNPQTVNVATLVTLDGSASNDPDSEPLTYQWTQVGGVAVSLIGASTAMPSFLAPGVPGNLTFSLVVRDPFGVDSQTAQVIITVVRPNDPPRCDRASATPDLLWPPNHKLDHVKIKHVKDQNRDQVTIRVDGVTQDEPVKGLGSGDTSPDAVLHHGGKLLLRAERSGNGDGRVYVIRFTATDEWGASCSGAVKVGVPHNIRQPPVDSGQLYDSMQP